MLCFISLLPDLHTVEDYGQVVLQSPSVWVFWCFMIHFRQYLLRRISHQVMLCFLMYLIRWHKIYNHPVTIMVVQSLSHVWLFATPWTAAHQASLSFIISQILLTFMAIGLVMLSNHLILCCPLLLLPSIFPHIRNFYNESALYIRWPKFQSCSISSSNEYSELISFRIDWFDLLAVQGTLKSVLQIHSSKASIL